MFTDRAPYAQDFFAALFKSTIINGIEWRRSVAKRHSDPRNDHAIAMLDALVVANDPLPDHLVVRLSDCRSALSRAAKEATRKVGFTLFPATLADLAQHALQLAEREQKTIAAVFPERERGR